MGAEYLIDTNVVIDFSSGKLPRNAHDKIAGIINTSPQISVINRIELLSLPEVSYQIVLFVEEAHVFTLSEEIVTKTIELRKKHKIKTPDAIIAATALVNKLKLVTHNVSDFSNVKGLKVIDSYSVV